MRRPAGFTLLEICLAVAIALLVTLVAVPSMRSVLEEQRLHRTFEAFDALVAKAQVRSVRERRTCVLIWQKDAIEMLPLERRDGESEPAPEVLPIGENESYELERPAALGPKPPAVWTFWRSGACEPVFVTYKGPQGTWKARYDALTARRTILHEELK